MMLENNCTKTRSCIAFVSVMAVMLTSLAGPSVSRAAGAPKYRPTVIPPDAGFTHSRVYDINRAGQVVGHFYNGETTATDRQAFVWAKSGGATLLATLSGETTAWGINDYGFVSGRSWNAAGQQRVVRWDTVGGGMVDIGALTNTSPEPDLTGETSSGFEINNHDQVVGHAEIPNDDGSFAPFHGFLYDTASGIQDLGTFTSDYPEYQNGYSIAYDINDSGAIVGCAHNGDWVLLPFIWDPTGGMQTLSRNPDYSEETQEWYAVVISEAGLIGGHVIAADNQSIPHYWPDAGSNPVQIPMPAEFPYGEIYGINAKGQMVGIMWDSDQEGATEHAFIYDPKNGVRDLNALIPSQPDLVLTVARDINDTGKIVGWGEVQDQTLGFVLVPQNNILPVISMLLIEE